MIRLPPDEFEDLVVDCFRRIPDAIADQLENLDIVIECWPSDELLDEMNADGPEALLGLFSGVTKMDGAVEMPSLPNKITLFQRPIEAMCETYDELTEEVRKTLLHEIGHYLGMEEDYLERLGYG